MDGNLTPHDVDTLLRELARRLHESDVAAGIRIVGGAPIALMNDQRGATRDIDAALAYIPPVGAEDRIDVVREGGVTIPIGAPQMLLARRPYANRGRRDADAIKNLLGV